MNKIVVCFGEVLWDNLPTGRQPGGAPMNVAYHLNRLGIRSAVISRVGRDKSGDELKRCLNCLGISDALIQVDPVYPTSEVLATIGDDNEVSYEIVSPVAWDDIVYEPHLTGVIRDADIFVYGSLVARGKDSRDTLMALLEKAPYRVFDVNLRSPHYTPPTMEQLLQQADTLKLNLQELMEISGWWGNRAKNERMGVDMLLQRYSLQELIVTKGAQGVSYYTPLVQYHFPAVPVQVKDTVGSGDAFLAAFLAQKLRGTSIEAMLESATVLGAFVTTQSGACPVYTKADLDRFTREKSRKTHDGK